MWSYSGPLSCPQGPHINYSPDILEVLPACETSDFAVVEIVVDGAMLCIDCETLIPV